MTSRDLMSHTPTPAPPVKDRWVPLVDGVQLALAESAITWLGHVPGDVSFSDGADEALPVHHLEAVHFALAHARNRTLNI